MEGTLKLGDSKCLGIVWGQHEDCSRTVVPLLEVVDPHLPWHGTPIFSLTVAWPSFDHIRIIFCHVVIVIVIFLFDAGCVATLAEDGFGGTGRFFLLSRLLFQSLTLFEGFSRQSSFLHRYLLEHRCARARCASRGGCGRSYLSLHRLLLLERWLLVELG